MRTNASPRLVLAAVLLAGSVVACSGGSATPIPTVQPSAISTVSTITASPAGSEAPAAAGTVSINAGGKAVGSFWADQFFSGGAAYGNDDAIDMSKISDNPPPAAIFNSERYGAMTYTIPNRSGPQNVTLYFSENYVSGVGERTFDVSINGATVLKDFDIFKTAGGARRAVAQTFTVDPDASGQILIGFVAHVQNPKISGIRVVGAGTTTTPPPPTPTPTPAAAPSTSSDAKASAGCGKARTLQDGTITIESGTQRTYILRTPTNYDPAHPYRLVMAYHWAGGTSKMVANGTGATESPFYGLWDLSNNSTIFVAPMGLGDGQNTGWPNYGGNDVAFTDAILAQVEASLCIDTTRIFANGFSYGAGMSYALACARPDVFRGVAVYSGALLSGCDGGTKPIALFAAHGLSDSVLDIARGRQLRDHFVQVNGVTPQNPPEPANGSGTHVCTTYQGGSPKYPVEWCAFDGDHNPNPHDSGQSSSWMPAQVWAFFSQF